MADELEAAHVMAHASDKMITAARKMDEVAEATAITTNELTVNATRFNRAVAVIVKMNGMIAANNLSQYYKQIPPYTEMHFMPLLNELLI